MEEKDNSTALALGVVAFVLALVIALVLALAIADAIPAPQAPASVNPPPAALARRTPAIATLAFAPGSAKLPSDLAAPLLKILRAAEEAPLARIRLEAKARSADEVELGRERELALAMALVGAGIRQDRILPEAPEISASPRPAHRVEVFLDGR